MEKIIRSVSHPATPALYLCDAKAYGSEKAHILWVLKFDEQFEAGGTVRQLHEVFDFLSVQKLARLLRELSQAGALKSRKLNDIKFDKSKIYWVEG